MSSGGQESAQMPQQPSTGGSVTDWVGICLKFLQNSKDRHH